MSVGPRSRAALIVAVPAVLLAVVGIAWACTPPTVDVNPDWVSSAGQTVTVSGEYFPSDSQIDISIEGNGQARYLTSVSGSSQWAVDVTVPADLPEGKYWVYARYQATDTEGQPVSGAPASALQVGQVDSAEPGPAEPGPAEPGPAEPQPADQGRAGSAPAEPSAGNAGGGARAEQAARSSGAASVTAAGRAGRAPAGNRRATAAELAALPKADLLVPEPSGGTVFAEGVAPAFSGGAYSTGRGWSYVLYGTVLLALGLVSIFGAAAALAVRGRRAHVRRAD